MFLSVVTYVNMCARYLFIVSRTNEKARLLENVKNVFNFKSRLQSTTEVEMNHGFAFSQEEGGAVSQSDMIRVYNTCSPTPEVV